MAARESGLAERPSADASPAGDVGAYPERREPALSELEFYGCTARPMTRAEYDDYEGRVEFFDSRAGIACIANEAAHFPHEDPLHMLGRLLERIALVRGSAIVCRGAAEIRRTFPDGQSRRIQPDQMVYLDPAARDRTGPRYLTARDEPQPDVVLEVDSTTDVRGNRLKLYEAWGFPEVWVEVPNAYAPGRRRGLRSMLRIYLLEAGRYVLSEESRAFPGWRATDIHRALNEPVISAATSAILSGVGRVLGEREGTGPGDDPLLRELRAEGHAAGRAEGYTDGISAGVKAGVAKTLLRQRGVAVPADFPAGLARQDLDLLQAAAGERIFAAASAARSVAEFFSRLDDPGS